MNEPSSKITDATDQPYIASLLDEFHQSLEHATFYIRRMELAENTTWCQWDGQHDDGRKHRDSDTDEEPFPWEGASDTRVRLVDQLVTESTLVQDAAFKRGRWRMAGTEAGDTYLAGKSNTLLKWMVYTKMGRSARSARKLARRWRTMYGLSFTMVDWERDVQLTLDEINLNELALYFGLQETIEFVEKQFAAEAELPADGLRLVVPQLQDAIETFLTVRDEVAQINADGLAKQEQQVALVQGHLEVLKNFLDLVDNPKRESELKKTFLAAFPTLKGKHLKKIIESLRENSLAHLPIPVVVRDQPYWRALKAFDHIFFPVETTKVESARWFAVREWYTAPELKAKTVPTQRGVEPWDAEFVDWVVEHTEGMDSTEGMLGESRRGQKRWQSSSRNHWEGTDQDRTGLFEILTFYYWATDDFGIPGIYKTVTSAHLRQDGKVDGGESQTNSEGVPLYAEHGLQEHHHAKYPFVPHIFEEEMDTLLENVGIPYLLYTYQNEVKINRDYLIDAGSISILPPLRRHVRDQDTPLSLGPDGAVFETVSGSTQYMDPPKSRADLILNADQAIRADACRLGGALHPDVPTPVVQIKQANLGEAYLDEQIDILTLTFQLMQQHMDEATIVRAVGRLNEPMTVSHEEIQGQFDLSIAFDARTLDPDYLFKKLDFITRLKPMDANNRMNNDRMVELLLTEFDPSWADFVLDSPEEKAQDEAMDELMNVGLMMAGVEPPMKASGQNYGLRLQVMDGQKQQNPKFQRAYEDDAHFRSLVDNRKKHLQHMITQFQVNAPTGRTGAQPITSPLGGNQL
ncbi:MAG: hypothetical protein AAFX93_19870 [Verrucomicrobiota bacterium]